jgi:HK97 family phage prohead protease
VNEVARTAETASASTVHKPFGKPGGKGLWGTGKQLPAYIQSVAHHLAAQGHDESKAIEMAVGIVRNWAEGHDGHGRKVHPDVQAAAAKAMAEWEKLRAEAHSTKSAGRSDVTQRAEMKAASINDLPDSAFAHIEPGGKKDASGRTVPRSLRHFPVHDAAHVRNALARAPQSPFGTKAMPKIRQAAKKYGVDVSTDSSDGASRSELMRDYPLEDLHIVRSGDGGDGRTMEAFAAVFNTETYIEDHQGKYLEVIEPFAFNKRIADLKRSRAGLGQVKVMFNHARDLQGNPEPRFMMPVATPVSIEATPRGLLTRSRFNGTPLAEEVLELVKSGSVTSMSFTGQIVRSDPQLKRGQRHQPGPSGLTVVRRQELGLKEFGPVLFAAYEDAGINGVRMFTPGTWEPDEEEIDTGTSPDGEAAAGEPLTPDGAEHSARYHQHALFRMNSEELRKKYGLVW